jgi:two-component system LytT family sensor kinase
MIERKLSFKREGWLRNNLRYAGISIIVGIVMSIFAGIFNPNGTNLQDILLTILFSFFITLSITNVIGLVLCYFSPNKYNFWRFILVYYGCNLAGMFIGIEFSYFIVSLIFNSHYEFLTHLNDYKYTSFITLIIGTLILLYHFQRINAEALLKEKEMELVKLNQLKTQAELQALQSKINPHFLYNALNSIVSLIHEDADKAEDMTIKLSKLFRYSINTMQENYCSIKEEVEILNTYLAIEKVRFGNRINFKINHAVTIQDQLIPRFLLQPLVENALKHGLKDTHERGELEVLIAQKESRIELLIADNGDPFPETIEAGYGLQSTYDKLQLLYKDDYELQINNAPNKHIKISIPLTK